MLKIKLGNTTYAYESAYIWIIAGFAAPTLVSLFVFKKPLGKSVLFGLGGAVIATGLGMKKFSTEMPITSMNYNFSVGAKPVLHPSHQQAVRQVATKKHK